MRAATEGGCRPGLTATRKRSRSVEVSIADATIQESSAFAHRSLPQANATQSVTQVIVQNTRSHSVTIQQGFVSGGSVTLTYNGRYLDENSPSNILNPSEAVSLALSAQHNLLQGRGIKLGSRNITIAKMNLAMSDNTFRAQVTRTVAQVLNVYYGLVGDYMDVGAKQGTLDTATTFANETSRRLELGAVAQLDVTTARNQVAQARLALANSNVTLQQRQVTEVILTGQVTEQCVLYSALDAHVRHLEVCVPPDAVAHIHPDLAEAALRMMDLNMGAEICPADKVVL